MLLLFYKAIIPHGKVYLLFQPGIHKPVGDVTYLAHVEVFKRNGMITRFMRMHVYVYVCGLTEIRL